MALRSHKQTSQQQVMSEAADPPLCYPVGCRHARFPLYPQRNNNNNNNNNDTLRFLKDTLKFLKCLDVWIGSCIADGGYLWKLFAPCVTPAIQPQLIMQSVCIKTM